MAFDDGPSFEEPGDPYQQDFAVTWTGLVSRTFTLWTRKIVQYVMIAAIPILILTVIEVAALFALFGIPGLALIDMIGSDPFTIISNYFLFPTLYDLTFVTLSLALSVVSIIITTIVAGATYKFALDNYGSPDSGDVGESYSVAISKVVPLIVVQLVVSGISLVGALPGIVLMAAAVLSMDLPLIMSALGVMVIGLIFTLYISVRLSVAGITVIAEDRSVVDALKRSLELTSGQFWHIFAGQILLIILVAVLSLAVGLFLGVIGIVLGALFFIVSIIITGFLFTPMNYIFSAVLYRDLISRTTVAQQEWW